MRAGKNEGRAAAAGNNKGRAACSAPIATDCSQLFESSLKIQNGLLLLLLRTTSTTKETVSYEDVEHAKYYFLEENIFL